MSTLDRLINDYQAHAGTDFDAILAHIAHATVRLQLAEQRMLEYSDQGATPLTERIITHLPHTPINEQGSLTNNLDVIQLRIAGARKHLDRLDAYCADYLTALEQGDY